MTNNLKKGFTLVELSIVLVIIGLLIGGILVAQSMINTTKIQALIRQTGSFDAAVANFYTKYNGLPGDSSIASFGGDGDGYISSSGATAGTLKNSTFTGEIANAWYDLSISGLSTDGAGGSNATPNTYAAAATAVTVGTTTASAPKAKAGNNAAGFIMVAIAAAGGTGNYYVVLNAAQATGSAWVTPTAVGQGALKAADALAVDTKLDDGSGQTGNVESILLTTAAAITAPGGLAATGCIANGTYTLTSSTTDCDIAIRVGINTGNMQ